MRDKPKKLCVLRRDGKVAVLPLFGACRDPLVGEKSGAKNAVKRLTTCHTPETVPTFEHETDQRSWETQN